MSGKPGSISPCCVTLGKPFNLSGLGFPMYENQDYHTNIMAILQERNDQGGRRKVCGLGNRTADPEGQGESGQGKKGRAAEKPRGHRPRLLAPAAVMVSFHFVFTRLSLQSRDGQYDNICSTKTTSEDMSDNLYRGNRSSDSPFSASPRIREFRRGGWAQS